MLEESVQQNRTIRRSANDQAKIASEQISIDPAHASAHSILDSRRVHNALEVHFLTIRHVRRKNSIDETLWPTVAMK